MDCSKKVSIIMGIYNCESTLNDSIKSIINQTYSNWEFIICDDGSTDDSFQIAKSFEESDPKRFKVIRNSKNRGLNATLNRCLKIADGDYVARMDGDDLCDPVRFQKEVDFLNSHPEYAIVSTYMTTFDEGGEWGCIKTLEYPQVKDFPIHVPMFCHAACMIRREAFLDVQGYTEDKRLLRVEDYHLWYKFYAKGYKGYNIQEALYKMRDDRNALHRRTAQARFNGIYAAFVGFKMVHIPKWMYVYAIKNAVIEIIKIIIPDSMYDFFHKKRLGQ
ncbi:glycosyltransferase family 2 protein [Sellimonas caecigallum]|uniref:Glycosyltransferase n=1 Tax=Sellimonas caecigallum TaxID=2592333 RepID=A0ABS7L895_9FIRM|nr:glycosyltransferase [Sellimonas caecigallum]MBY0759326.1 glycosyltransferase [Sellimonas caecigallum]